MESTIEPSKQEDLAVRINAIAAGVPYHSEQADVQPPAFCLRLLGLRWSRLRCGPQPLQPFILPVNWETGPIAESV